MASLYKRNASPFWWIKWRNPVTGKIERQSTGFKIGVGEDFRRAKSMRDQFAVRETRLTSRKRDEAFNNWVADYLSIRYAKVPETLTRNLTCWQNIAAYFDSVGVHTPRQVKRTHCLNYFRWRQQGDQERGIRRCAHNTIRLELAIMSVIMKEALRREMIEANPCTDLGVKRKASRPKPEITDDEIQKIRSELANPKNFEAAKYDWPHILRVSFEIAIHQGCRLSETYLDVLRDVDLENQLITFHAKGDDYYQTELNPNLVPLFDELRKSGRRMTYVRPEQRTHISLYWKKFLTRIGLGHLSFHCTRVTVVSRMERSGTPEALTMRLVNHASTTVHRVYRRVKKAELAEHWPKLPPFSGKPK